MYLSKLFFGAGARFFRPKDSESFGLNRLAHSKGFTVFNAGLDYCNGISQPLLYRSFLRLVAHRKFYSVCSKASSSTLHQFYAGNIAENFLSGFLV